MYRAFSASAASEYDLLVKNHHARTVSRIGFVVQDMKDFQYEVLNAIRDRASVINNYNAECILDAQRGLEGAAEEAGNVIVFTSRDWYEEVNLVNDIFVTPVLKELDIIASLFEIETLGMLAWTNPVINIEDIVSTLYLEALLYEVLFEYFVIEILYDFNVFDSMTDEKNGRIFPALDRALTDFRFTGNVIRNSLANCNG